MTLPVTEAPWSWAGVASTASPSTRRMGVKETSAPSSVPRSSTCNCWPSATRSCLPPVAITAYIACRSYPGRSSFQQGEVDHHAAPVTIRALIGEVGQQTLADALAGHLDEAQ